MLSHLRVLDLTDERGQLAGFILAQLGAEVIAIEPPGGTPTRHRAPFAGDRPDPDGSLLHWAQNRGKRSVVLDTALASDNDALRRLIRGADILLESFDPIDPDPMQLGAEPTELNAALVHVTITPYGADGPRSGWQATDLTTWASTGALELTGDPDRAPLRISQPQAWCHGAADAAGAALVAITERVRSGCGQRVEVSAQASAMLATQANILAAHNRGTSRFRAGGGTWSGKIPIRLLWPCKDGQVSLTFHVGPAIGPFSDRLFAWLFANGACSEADSSRSFVQLDELLTSGEVPLSEWARLSSVVGDFVLTKTKAELLQAALDHKLLFAPIADAADLAELDQLHARDWWEHVDHPDRPETVRYPGRFAALSETPLVGLGPPPKLGEHTAELLAEPHRSPDVVVANSVTPIAGIPTGGTRALDGLKVLDFMWAIAGPAFTRTLADHGATVVRIESATRPDTSRTVSPFVGDEPGRDASLMWQNFNAGKLSLDLDMGHSDAREVILDLVRWADVVSESFSPGRMAAWGLSWSDLREINPSLIMVSSSLLGQTGPMATYAGFGTMAAALGGFNQVTGWPDGDPVGPFSAYTDYVAPRFLLPVTLAALEHRRLTGIGQHIDLSQTEASLHFLGTALLDYSVNGRVASRQGNDDPGMAPHGVYPCRGEQRWVAIACADDNQWQSLAATIGQPGLARDQRFAHVDGRLARRRELDEMVLAWTTQHDSDEAANALQAVGVAAYPVIDSARSLSDPQLEARGHFVSVRHGVVDDDGEQTKSVVEAPRFKLSRTPGRVDWAGPTLGQHRQEVLAGILGYGTDQIEDLRKSGVLQ